MPTYNLLHRINYEIYDKTTRVQQMVKFVTEPACIFIFLRLKNKCFSGIDSNNLKLIFGMRESQQCVLIVNCNKRHRITLYRLLQLQFDNILNRRNIIFQNFVFSFGYFVYLI